MQRDEMIKRILKNSDFYTEDTLLNYSQEQLYTVLKYYLFIDLKDKIENQKTHQTNTDHVSKHKF